MDDDVAVDRLADRLMSNMVELTEKVSTFELDAEIEELEPRIW